MQDLSRGFWARAWHGEERLWKVWWLLGVPLALASAILSPATISKFATITPLLATVFAVAFAGAYISLVRNGLALLVQCGQQDMESGSWSIHRCWATEDGL